MSSVAEQLNKFEALVQHLPAGRQQLAIENRAFLRSRHIKSQLELLRLVFAYLIADNSLRSLAATLISRRVESPIMPFSTVSNTQPLPRVARETARSNARRAISATKGNR